MFGTRKRLFIVLIFLFLCASFSVTAGGRSTLLARPLSAAAAAARTAPPVEPTAASLGETSSEKLERRALAKESQSKLSITDEWIGIRVGADNHQFHFFWLYHNCSSWLHPTTRECQIDVCDIPLDIKPRQVKFYDDILRISWPGNRTSEFALEWLVKHSYAMNLKEVPPPGGDVANTLEVDYQKLKETSRNFDS